MSFCKVTGCRFPSTHLTRSHKCGKCNHFGHGQRECGDNLEIDNLKNISNHVIFPSYLKCTSLCCPAPSFHSTESHYCSYCDGRHIETQCQTATVISTDENEIKRVIIEAKKKFGSRDGKIYTTVYSGHGCDWYVKRTGFKNPIQLFFMHGDSWGQFGPQCDDRPKLNKFCTGFIDIDTREMYVPK
jgi:hypothetical protein